MLDLSKYKKIHCIGIGGIGLSAIAEVLLFGGHEVSGSDMKENDIVLKLRESGICVNIGQSEENVKDIDLIVYSSAVSEDNVEIKAAKERGIPCCSRAEVLGAIMRDYKNSIAVSGTHGKTTTTSMVSLILQNALKDPTILVGGNLGEINGNVRVGKSEYIVTEACEYRDSFLELNPYIEIILNIDSDHLDYFKDIDHIAKSFAKFAGCVPSDGTVIAFDANPFVKSIIDDLECDVITFGFNEHCDYYASEISFNAKGCPKFKVNYRGEELFEMHMSIPGEHNIANALAAIACTRKLGIETEYIIETLSAYKGTQRRFDIIGVTGTGVTLVDDYAHHPTEIKATLKAARNVEHKKLWCLFQPHTYTRTLALFDSFAESFRHADKIVIAEIYAAREKNTYNISSKKLVEEIKKQCPDKEVYFFEDFEGIAGFVLNNADRGDLVITMGAGDIYKVAEMILEKDGEMQR